MQKRAEETQRRILESATELFAAKGIKGATTDAIAEMAQVNKQRIYAYFNSKNGLFEKVLLNVFESVELFSEKMLEEAEAHPDQLTRLVLDDFLRVHGAHPVLWRLLAWANLEGARCTEALNMARKKENDRLRAVYQATHGDRGVSFEIWLFTLLAVSCFRYSNELTLVHTLGWNPADPAFEARMLDELGKLF